MRHAVWLLSVSLSLASVLVQSKLMKQTRTHNMCIKSRHSLNMAILLNQLPPEKLQDYDKFPLSHRIGFIHSIAEQNYDISSATILDVGFLGLFPRKILQSLNHYAMELDQTNPDGKHQFMSLIQDLITAFIYQPIIIQKVIQIMLTHKKDSILQLPQPLPQQNNNADDRTQYASQEDNTPRTRTSTTRANIHATTTLLQVCHANKCRLLHAKGILRRPMLCANKRTMCSGCINESLWHRKVKQIEMDILSNTQQNSTWAPILEYVHTPTNLAHIRYLLQHLPSTATNKRNDHIYGATRYIANSLGLTISNNTNMGDFIDKPLSSIEKKQLWRLATFKCRCLTQSINTSTFGPRIFCNTCQFLIPKHSDPPQETICPLCHINAPWQHPNAPCLACQVATIVYRNLFHNRFQHCLQLWLHTADQSTDENTLIPQRTPTHWTFISNHDMLPQRQSSIG